MIHFIIFYGVTRTLHTGVIMGKRTALYPSEMSILPRRELTCAVWVKSRCVSYMPRQSLISNQISLKLPQFEIPSTSNQTTLQQQEQVSFHLNYVGMIDFSLKLVFFLGLVFF